MDNQQQGYFPSQEQQAMLDPSPPGAHFPTITAKEEASFLELSPDALVIVDREGMIVLVNEPAATLFGYSLEELVDQPLEVLLPERFHAAHATHRAEYIMAPHRRPMGVGLDLRGKRKDGSEFPVDIQLAACFHRPETSYNKRDSGYEHPASSGARAHTAGRAPLFAEHSPQPGS